MRTSPSRNRLGIGAILTAGLLAIPGAASAQVDSWDTADARWRSGPVRYLLTKQEEQAYKKLKTDEERSRFVEDFWATRDPSAGTPQNEYREAFYWRAREAASRFTEDGGKGWQDDRGRVFILLGPPDQTEQGSGLLGGSDSASGPDITSSASGTGFGLSGASDQPPQTEAKTAKFIYLQNPMTGEGRLEVSFKQDVTGGYRLDGRLDWEHPVLRGLSPSASPAAGTGPAVAGASTPAAHGTPAPPSPAAPAPTLEPAAPPAPPPTPESELMELVRGTPDLKTTLPLDVTINYYKAADASTFATLTLELRRDGLPASSDPDALILSAEILDPETGESEQRFFKNDQFGAFEGNHTASINDTLLYQAERPLTPGKYRAVFAVKDPASGGIGRLEKDIEVPSFEETALTLSTVTLVRKIEPLKEAPASDSMTPFVLGNFEVVPRPDNVFKKDEQLAFYYQIYGATPDTSSSAYKLDLSYAFEKKIGTQWKMVGGQPAVFKGQPRLVQAFSLPMKGWPPGEYRVGIKVTDTLGGNTVQAELPFTIAVPDKPAKPKG